MAIDAQLSSSSRNAVENRVITNTLNEKQDTIGDIESIRSGASKGATSIQPGDSLSLLDNSASGFQTAGDVATAISTKADTSALTELSNTVSTLQATVEEQATTIENIEIAT